MESVSPFVRYQCPVTRGARAYAFDSDDTSSSARAYRAYRIWGLTLKVPPIVSHVILASVSPSVGYECPETRGARASAFDSRGDGHDVCKQYSTLGSWMATFCTQYRHFCTGESATDTDARLFFAGFAAASQSGRRLSSTAHLHGLTQKARRAAPATTGRPAARAGTWGLFASPRLCSGRPANRRRHQCTAPSLAPPFHRADSRTVQHAWPRVMEPSLPDGGGQVCPGVG